MPLGFQFQIGGSWGPSFVRESITFQFREESNLLFQDTAPHKIYPSVQGRGGSSHPYQRAGGDTKKNYRLTAGRNHVTPNKGIKI